MSNRNKIAGASMKRYTPPSKILENLNPDIRELVNELIYGYRTNKDRKVSLAFHIAKLNPFDPFGVVWRNKYLEAGKVLRVYKKKTRPIKVKY